MKKVTIYTDGACSGNPGNGGYGAVLFYDRHRKELAGAIKDTTNNRMELLAAIKALECLSEECKVTLYSDSAYLVNAFNEGWIEKWKRNNYKNSEKKQVKNLDLWLQLIAFSEKHKITFIKVKGHSDNEYNNRCDEIATKAIKELEAGLAEDNK